MALDFGDIMVGEVVCVVLREVRPTVEKWVLQGPLGML